MVGIATKSVEETTSGHQAPQPEHSQQTQKVVSSVYLRKELSASLLSKGHEGINIFPCGLSFILQTYFLFLLTQE